MLSGGAPDSACHAVAAETTRVMHADAKKVSSGALKLKAADLKLLKDAQVYLRQRIN